MPHEPLHECQQPGQYSMRTSETCAKSSPSIAESQDPASSHNTPKPQISCFLRLSPELRNQIYQLVCDSAVLHIGAETPGLSLTCEQFYGESIELFYASTAFYVESWDILLQWLQQLLERRRLMIAEIWCGSDMSLPDSRREDVSCHGVLRRMSRRLRKPGLPLYDEDVLRAGVRIDDVFTIWSSNPDLAWLAVGKVHRIWSVSSPC
jgi:hypothetical protein